MWILLGVKVWVRVNNNTVWLYVLERKKKSKGNGGRGKLLMRIMYIYCKKLFTQFPNPYKMLLEGIYYYLHSKVRLKSVK